MRSAEYWEQAALQREIAVQEGATATLKDILKLYDEALDYINDEMRKIKFNFQKRYGLDDKTAAMYLTQAQREENLASLIYALENAPNEKARQQILDYIHRDGLSVRAYASRIERYDAVKQSIYARIKRLAVDETKIVAAAARKAYSVGYYSIMDDTAKGLDVGIGFGILNDDAIDAAVNAKWHGARFSERIWKNTDKLADEAQKLVTKSIMSGESWNKTAQKLAARFEVEKYHATTLVHTEAAHAHAMADMKAYEDLGIEEYKYLATLDYITCETCQALDGQVFRRSEAKEGINYPVMHPRCRCTTTMNIDYSARRARNPETGRNYKVDGSMNYEEWIKSLTPEQKKALEVSRLKDSRRVADKAQYGKYKHVFGSMDGFPKSFDKFQDMKYNDKKAWEQFKANKQAKINSMDFKDMKGLIGQLGNKEVRLWYKTHNENIPNLLDKTKPLREQARQAFEMRNKNRTNARELMKDIELKKELEHTKSNKDFDYYFKKYKTGNKTDEEVYREIIKKSTITNAEADKKAGVE